MKVPLSWLREYIELTEPASDIAGRLTFTGIEVEAVETIGAGHSGLIVGEVRSVEKHPNADKLTVCRVFDGKQELQVVCGAPNARAGGRYPFAPVGSSLKDGAMRIKPAKLRGVESSGMLCAEDELGLSDRHEGLLELDGCWPAGTPIADVLGPPETVFELEITPNRPDCLGLIGIARELAAVYGTKVRVPAVPAAAPARERLGARTTVTVEDTEGCPRYTARLLRGVRIGPAPAWMRQRLERAGIRPINNVVDITNYVMLETGQPLHAFDLSLLKDERIVVRRARKGEKMATLDGVERELDPSLLVIADMERPVAVAGVMGGAGSEIRDETSDVLLESAWFLPTGVRATARKLGLSTESSYRFERGVDIGAVERASRRAAALMAEHAGATIEPGVIDAYPAPVSPRRVSCRFDRVRAVTGMDVKDEEILRIFDGLELDISGKERGGCAVTVPTFRGDLAAEVDLIEEVARLHGLDKVPSPLPRARLDAGADDDAIRAAQDLRRAIAALGLREICNYSLLSNELLDLFDAASKGARVVIPRPISADQSALRASLVPQMVDSLGRNRARQVDRAALFEIGRVFRKGSGKWPEEEDRLVVGLMGAAGRMALDARKTVAADESFLWLKGIWAAIASARRLSGWSLAETALPWGEAGAGFSIAAGGRALGVMGMVRREIRKEWRLNDPVAVLDVAVAPLLAHLHDAISLKAIPAHPCVVRDMALVVDECVKHGDILAVIREAAPAELERVEVFDIFRGGNIPAGRKSMAYSLTYRSSVRTLTDDEANGYHNAVKDAVRRDLRAEIRES